MKTSLPLMIVSMIVVGTSYAAGPPSGGASNASAQGIAAGIGNPNTMPGSSPASAGLGINTALTAPITVSSQPPVNLPVQATVQSLNGLANANQALLTNVPPTATPITDHGAQIGGMARDLAATARATAQTGGVDFKDVIHTDAQTLSNVARQNPTPTAPESDLGTFADVPATAVFPPQMPDVPASYGSSDEAGALAELAKGLPRGEDASMDKGAAARSLADQAKELFSSGE